MKLIGNLLLLYLWSVHGHVITMNQGDGTVVDTRGHHHHGRPTYVEARHYHVLVHGNKTVAQLDHFWESTGFCPPEPHNESYKYFLSEDIKHNLAYIGAIPNKGIKLVRIHWLLDLVTVNSGVYNFTYLDQLMDVLQENGLYPGFELMGNPSGVFTDFENHTQILRWRDLVHAVAKRYIGRYGQANVEQWRFESWNEPDHKDFDDLNMTVAGFLNYYDSCSEGLRLASPALTFGGPAASCRKPSYSKMCWALLKHIESGDNYFGHPSKLDFISFHIKGGRDETGNSSYLLLQELNTTHRIWAKHPKLKNVPIVNDEADPVVGWSKPLQWRADSTYAAIVVKIIAQHQNLFKQRGLLPNYSLLSNDNGFLTWNPNFFTQRTLLARFQMNNTRPSHVSFIRKPVYDTMGLLSLLGEKQISTGVAYRGEQLDVLSSRFGVLASVHESNGAPTDSWEMSLMVYNSDDTNYTFSNDFYTIRFTLHPNMEKSTDLYYVQYSIDNTRCNPYLWWEALDCPSTPSPVQMNMMRLQQCPSRTADPQPLGTRRSFHMSLPLPGLTLYHICAKPAGQPDQVSEVRVMNITRDQVLIAWSDGCVHSRCLKTYEVEYSANKDGPYTRINLRDDVTTIYAHTVTSSGSPSRTVIGYYRVRAVDYWSRGGAYSLPQYYGHATPA